MVAIAHDLPSIASALDDVLARLKPEARAKVRWFKPRVRAEFLEPLRRISIVSELDVQLEQLIGTYELIREELAHEILPVVSDTELIAALRGKGDERVTRYFPGIAQRLEPIDAYAADELREALVWDDLWAKRTADVLASAHPRPKVEDAPMPPSPRSVNALTRISALLLASSEAIMDERELPPLLPNWCDLLYENLFQGAQLLRSSGVFLPPVVIPGVSPVDMRRRWIRHMARSLPEESADDFIEGLW